MANARITESGGIVIPKDILERLCLHAGDTVDLEVEEGGVVRIYPKALQPSQVCGMLGSSTQIKSMIEEMDDAVAEAFRNNEL